MPLSWNDIRARALNFSREWSGAARENADKQTFWNEFFEVFGKKRRLVAYYEEPVKKLSGDYAFIDLFWPGTLIAERKTRGADLSKAHSQGMAYARSLVDSGREAEAPRYLVVSDFARLALHDLEPENDPDVPLRKRPPPTLEFPLADLHQHVHAFGFMAGYRTYRVKEEDPANIEAAEILARLHDVLEDGGYPKPDLDRFLVRILFCLFAEDTGIFQPNAFRGLLHHHTAEDGSNLGPQLAQLFDVLNCPEERRQKNLAEHLAEMPYVNGRLFGEHLAFASFNREMRNALLGATRFDWARISPAVFGSLFQAIMQPRQRRQIGAHYTSERDIMKVVRSLFLDDLRARFQRLRADRSNRRASRLRGFQAELAALRLLDPACGCGNFLILAYRELRQLEIEVLLELHRKAGGRTQTEMSLDEVNRLARVDVDQLFGLEIEEWPARIAEVAVWLMDHLMNQRLSVAFGQIYQRLPLRKSATIITANALRTDWKTLLPPSDHVLILGNPPFVGGKYQDVRQREDMALVAGAVKNFGLLDYVCGWYFKAAEYVRGTRMRCAFVSTNSLSQGEQAGTLWNELFGRHQLKIHFAHRTFAWMSEARGKAHVHVVIIGFGAFEDAPKRIYDYEGDPDNPIVTEAANISPYLVPGPDFAITNRSAPLCDVPGIGIGNKPIDDGNYLFTPQERRAFLKAEPRAKRFFRRWVGSEEFINGIERWCLWLGEANPAELRAMPLVMQRIEAVRKFRLASKSKPTQALAHTPTRFHVENMPTQRFLVVPKVSSEKRAYIPMGFVLPQTLVGDACLLITHAEIFHFGILTSAMHMAWVRQICGRLKSDYRYSNKLVYNNYPWPMGATKAQQAKVEACAQAVLAARAPFLKSGATLADLYDARAMPAALHKAHLALDKAVDRCYRREAFQSDRERIEFLFHLYERLSAPLVAQAGRPRPLRR